MTDTIDRRSFLKRSAVTAGAAVAATSGLQRITEHAALAEANGNQGKGGGNGRNQRQPVEPSQGYGALGRMADQRGVEVLALPAGFAYVTFG